ncbi:MAG: tetratricopeptide repeat protein [Verrucomicrobiota bacterium]
MPPRLACGEIMVAAILDLLNPHLLLGSPLLFLLAVFQLWMLIHAIRQREWLWVFFLLIGWGISAFFYYMSVYRASGSSSTRGFELPGAQNRRRIKELQAQIHHLDKAHHHSQLGDVYFQQGKLDLADASYRAALERDPADIDTRAHYGQCLLRQNKPAEARPWLEGVVKENLNHDYGFSQMALAETLAALGDIAGAIAWWKNVTAHHSYARAKVQLAELYLAAGQPELARPELQEVISDDAHSPVFQRKRDRVWVQRAKSLLKRL